MNIDVITRLLLMNTDGFSTLPPPAYGIIWDVFTEHFPVVIGVVVAVAIFFAPFVYDAYQKRKGAPTEPPPAPVKRDQDSMFAQKGPLEESKEYLADMALLERYEKEIDSDEDRLAGIIDEMLFAGTIALAYYKTGAHLLAKGDDKKALGNFRASIDKGKNWRPPLGAALSMEAMCQYHRDRNENSDGLMYARKAIILFEKCGMQEKVDEMKAEIKKLKRASNPSS
jgi:hypothetical protein